jgi:hypothetical protein
MNLVNIDEHFLDYMIRFFVIYAYFLHCYNFVIIKILLQIYYLNTLSKIHWKIV